MLKHEQPGHIFISFFWLWIQFYPEKVKATPTERNTNAKTWIAVIRLDIDRCSFTVGIYIYFKYILYLNNKVGGGKR